ncbi:beta-glucosidase BoGH3B-like isoform X1 [Hordeum vulgare subsp. vulgare]|uniref:beta-glucosidase BoGH3B-like isoform X1 n=1 Tax=Hordeum vulgare subsp. vulgare TaxID=112509 RepID=UPI001D1A41FC|nr:beta-glucosidase BoGH3B-like isoform X1 [Hordeum vulgare subsp. vulgare]
MAAAEGERPLYKDASAPVDARVRDLLGRMTLREKAAQMAQIERTVVSPSALTELGVGSVLNAGGSAPRDRASPADWAGMVDDMQRLALSSRLAIPILYGTDAVHGHNNVFGATVFPHNVGLGASRDAELVRKIGKATALEVRATGIHWAFAPCVAVCRDPRWGRCYESYSEDPEIVRSLTTIVTGLQGQPPADHPHGQPFLASVRYSGDEIQQWNSCILPATRLLKWVCVICRDNVLACAKHFVGDGGTAKGINEGNTICSPEDLERIHMTPYPDCMTQGVATVMASYSQWNGEPLHSSHHLLTDVLKGKLGFEGFVVSDWEGIDRLCEPRGSDYRYCIAQSVIAGMDMIMIPHRFEKFLEDLVSLVETGEIPISRIDDAVERILRVKFISGVFEHPFSDPSLLDVVGCKEHRLLAREAVRESLVLLKNGKNQNEAFLPLAKNAKRILVAGTHADNIGYQCGGWTIAWHGDSGKITLGTSILEAIRESVGVETEVVCEECPTEAIIESGEFSYAIVAVGEVPYAEWLGDRTDLSIPFNGSDLITRVASKVPTLVIVVSGRPLVIEPQVLEKIDALVAAWLPGSEGMGITDCLFGDHDFVGTLPVTWFRSADQLPINVGDANYDPLFPFGYGLKMFKSGEDLA